ncbi:MAG: zinc ribbon domain-containing protein [Myxococcaceae bacterium]|nr:zinc ribbon domain-containing protein [Myxococcaceae bacterium]
MPIYVYRCEKCQNEVELMQKVSDPAPGKCASCGAEGGMERQMSRTSFVLKGGGWYNDLYASSKKDGGSTPAPSSSASTSTPASTSSTASSTAPSTPAATSSTSSTGSSSGSGGKTT